MFLQSKENRREIVLKIIENHSGELFEEHRICVRINSQYTQFGINPLKSLNFSAVIFGENRTKYFQINNTGLFDLHYYICNWAGIIQGKNILQDIVQESLEPVNTKGKSTSSLSIYLFLLLTIKYKSVLLIL